MKKEKNLVSFQWALNDDIYAGSENETDPEYIGAVVIKYHVCAQVTEGRSAHHENGIPTECDTPTSVDILDIMSDGKDCQFDEIYDRSTKKYGGSNFTKNERTAIEAAALTAFYSGEEYPEFQFYKESFISVTQMEMVMG